MIRGIHYFSTELKTEIGVIPRGCFKMIITYFVCKIVLAIFNGFIMRYIWYNLANCHAPMNVPRKDLGALEVSYYYYYEYYYFKRFIAGWCEIF